MEDYDKSGKIDVKDFLKMTNEEVMKKNGGERFSIALGNPPYDRGTHLKFLEKTIEISDKVVFIQPVNWLTDMSAEFKKSSSYNKYENSISKHIKDLEIITGNNATNYFGTEGNVAISMDLGIYVCDDEGGYDYKKPNKFPFYLYEKREIPFKIGLYKDNEENNIVPLGNINGCVKRGYPSIDITTKYGAFNKGKDNNGKTFRQLKNANPHFTLGNIDTTKVAIFDTYNEAQNFYKMCKSIFWKVICYKSTSSNSIPINVLQWPDNYTKEWTEERFIEHFKMTEKDIKEYNEIKKELQDRLSKLK